ncbi:putative leucine permease transcriptional regulator [Erysiphe neolycopersici]|uniref:Putative leucine permease transcriptional regulator n=1 Tax=Erysiphe neolycopersici TaxID=212602 RepID=A0A420HDH1_9PEZI|nr:putative leucine permease transcriptional regulator [Erysiphe neolycopersici]
MSTPFFGIAPPKHNPFATGNPNKDVKPNFLNFARPVNGFGTPSGPIPSVFGSKTTSSNSAVWPNVEGTNPKSTPTLFPESADEMKNNTGFVFGTNPLNKSPFQPLTNSIKSQSNLVLENMSNSQKIFGTTSMKNEPQGISASSGPSQFKFPSSAPQESSSNSNLCGKTGNISTTFAEKIKAQLIKDRIFPPKLTDLDYNSEQSVFIKAASELKKEYSNYREKVRASLIKANLLDDPKVQKKLADAIDFKGICEQMCPEYECIARIVEGRHDKTEREIKSDGSLATQPKFEKMVKALARSAAGQDAPLPCDIRTAAALRRTVDYLFNDILAERELESVHGFLWDRTRAIRRDFVFHSSVTPTELLDQIYCLERIIRFHAISLHYMSKDSISTEGFSDQQEREQLSRSLLSLIHAYDDCKKQGIECENENEFKAYYIVFNGEIPGILETVQNWGFDLWENSEIIRNAVCLSESLQNTWDFHGPLNPVSTMEVGQNTYSRFFSIVEDPSTSYTMACFAEIYFNKIRKGILRTILSSYRKQRNQTKDWTAQKLNIYLRFDDQNEVEPFVELYGLRFAETDNEWCLSFDSKSSLKDPIPLPKQPHSYHLVERKRGTHSLVEAINSSVFEQNPPPRQSISHDFLAKDLIHEKKTLLNNKNEPYLSRQSHIQVQSNPFAMDQSDPSLKSITNGTVISPFNQNPSKSVVSDSLFVDSNIKSSKKLNNFSTPNFQSLIKDTPDKTSSQQQPVNKKRHFYDSSNSDFTNNTPKEKIIKTSTWTSLNPPGSTEFQSKDTTISSAESNKKTHNIHQITKSYTKNSSGTALFDSPNSVSKPDENNSIIYTESDNKNLTPTFPPQLDSMKTISPTKSLHQSSILENKAYEDIVSNRKLLKSPQEDINKKILNNQRNIRLEHFTKWIFMGDEGLLEQFSDFLARNIVHDTFSKYQTEKLKKLQEEAEKDARTKADQFRRHSLSVKFGYFWREQARRIRLKRKGREARQLRIEMAQSLKSNKEALSSSLVEDFKASTKWRQRETDSNSIAVCNPNSNVNAQLKDKRKVHKRRRSDKSSSSNYSSPSRHQNSVSNNSLNRSLLSDPSYLSGQSRIQSHHSLSGKDHNPKPFNGVKSDYFRLKARGVTNHVERKPSFNSNSEILHHATSNESLNNYYSDKPKTFEDKKSNLNGLKINKSFDTLMDYRLDLKSPYKNANQQKLGNQISYKRGYTDDDSALFDRAKKVRDQMDEGAEWFKSEIKKGEFYI